MNNFVLYRHIRSDKQEPFYIGIGVRSRAYDFKYGRNRHWRGIHKSNDEQTEVEVMIDELSWEEACKMEKWWIAFYGRADLGKGPLCNLTDGGEGAYGRIKSPETIEKQKRTLAANGRTTPMVNKKHTQEAIEKIRQASLNQIRDPEMFKRIADKNKGRKLTPEQNDKFTLSKIGRASPNRRKVMNIETGIEYNSVMCAAKINSIPKTTMLRWVTNNTNDYKFI